MIKLIFLMTSLIASSAVSATLQISITGLKNSTGNILIALYKSSAGFPNQPKKAFKSSIMSAQQKTYEYKNLPAGDYAIAIAHDENSNRELDISGAGLPLEGFGFSNNPRLGLGAPRYEAAKFLVTDSAVTSMKIKLIYLSSF
jgi:uncharacterized protein (DUF2141 family)